MGDSGVISVILTLCNTCVCISFDKIRYLLRFFLFINIIVVFTNKPSYVSIVIILNHVGNIYPDTHYINNIKFTSTNEKNHYDTHGNSSNDYSHGTESFRRYEL